MLATGMKYRLFAAVAAFCAVFAITSVRTALGAEFVEPRTGARITYPDSFSHKTEKSREDEAQGPVYIFWEGDPQSAKARLEISADSAWVSSIYSVMKEMVSSIEYEDAAPWWLHALTRNHAAILTADSSYHLHLGWMTAGGNLFLRVRAVVPDKATLKRVFNSVTATFGNDPALLEKRLMSEVAYTNPYDNELTGLWMKTGTDKDGSTLEIYGDRLFNFLDREGKTRAYGMYYKNYGELRVWTMGSPVPETIPFAPRAGEPITLAFSDAGRKNLNGEYRLAEKPFSWGAYFWGKWADPAARHRLIIGQMGLQYHEQYMEGNVTHNFVRASNYVETPEGLIFSNRDHRATFLRKVKGGGIAMDGVAATLFQEGMVLPADKADLSGASDLILEPASPPQNLGGWRQTGNNTALFRFALEEAGLYKATLLCSRKGDGDAFVALSVGDGKDQSARTTVKSTGTWADYEEFAADSLLAIPAGNVTLRVNTADPGRGEYLMNLRSIRLTPME